MYKYIFLVVSIVLFFGCSADHTPHVSFKMFQSVSEKEAILVQKGANKRHCVICGMDLVKFYKTSHAATHKDKAYQYCSIHCLADHLGQGVTLKNPKVVDVDSLDLIDVTQAHYVVGSSKRGTMSRVSKYAFLDEKKAQAFQKKFGGKIMNFTQALEVAQKDFIKR